MNTLYYVHAVDTDAVDRGLFVVAETAESAVDGMKRHYGCTDADFHSGALAEVIKVPDIISVAGPVPWEALRAKAEFVPLN